MQSSMLRINVGFLVLVALTLGLSLRSERSLRAQQQSKSSVAKEIKEAKVDRASPTAQPKPEVAREKAVEEPITPIEKGSDLEEEVTRTREDIANLELWLNAKKAQLRAAEMSTEVEHGVQSNYDRLAQKGMTSSLRQKIASLEVLEADFQRATVRAEIGDLETRLKRSKRYLTRLETIGTAAITPKDDRALEVTELLTRLRYAEQAITKLQEELKDLKSEHRERSRGGANGL